MLLHLLINQSFVFIKRERLGEIVSLDHITSVFLKEKILSFRFNAFCDGRCIQHLRQVDNHLDDVFDFGVRVHATDKLHVDFHNIEWQVRERAEGGITTAEVIDFDLEAVFPDFFYLWIHRDGVGHESRLGNL